MTTIGVIGANGQVGSEVCLFLREMGVDVVAVSRSQLGSAPLRRWGIPVRCGSLDRREESQRLLEGCELVADFALPRGEQAQMRASSSRIQASAIAAMPPRARYVYASSLMAFGMSEQSPRLGWHRLARTPYGRFKRHAERNARRLGREAGREVFVLRLGEVHGELQAVSRQVASRVSTRRAFVEDRASYTVFVFTIAEALVNIAAGREEPGTYSLVSQPEWSWPEVYAYYCRRAGIAPDIEKVPIDAARERRARAAIQALRGLGVAAANALALRYRDLALGYLLAARPELEGRLRSRYHVRRAAAEIAALNAQEQFRPYREPYRGRAPGRRLASSCDCRQRMEPLARAVRERLRLALAADA